MLVFVGTLPEKLAEGDLVSFDYSNPNQNQISRCGTVEGFKGAGDNRCVLVYDYSLEHGPGYRSYRLDRIRGLGVIGQVTSNVAPLQQFKTNFAQFTNKFIAD
jgi:hypothetical protein